MKSLRTYKNIPVKVLMLLVFVIVIPHTVMANTAEVILHNGTIYTAGQHAQFAEAVAIKDGRILVAGTKEAVKKHLGKTTEVIDLEGAFVMPGIVETHTHGFEDYHKPLFQLDLDTSSPEDLLRTIKHYADKNPDKEWLTGGMWPNGMFPNDSPTAAMLDEIVADRPVFLIDQSGHSAWLNTKALEATGFLAEDFKEGEGFVVVRDEKGVPSGTIREYAIGFARRSMEPVPQEEWIETGRQMQEVYHKYGITTTRLATASLDHVKAARTLEDAGELNMYLSISLTHGYFDSPLTLEQQIDSIEQADDFVSEQVDPRAVKLFMDGTQLAREAWNVKPYPDDPKNFGTAYYSQEELNALYDKMTKLNRMVAAHSCGSMSVRAALNAIEYAKKKNPDATVRHHIMHAIQIAPEDLGRAKALGAGLEISPILIMNPDLKGFLTERVGSKTVDEMWPARAALDAGERVAFASDWNVAPLDPWAIMEYLTTRENEEFPEMGKVSPKNAVSVKEAIDGYTINAAYTIAMDDRVGSIEPGKSADLVVLDRNPFDLEKRNQLNRISETEVLYTVFQGEIVFENEEALMPAHYGWQK